MVPDALVNFGACPVVSVRLMIAPPIARRLSNMSCRIGSSGCGSGGSREIDACSSANANGAVITKPSSTQHIKFCLRMVDLLGTTPCIAVSRGDLSENGNRRCHWQSSGSRCQMTAE